jgi:EmrB/QacA subfamily drug resistance transporter
VTAYLLTSTISTPMWGKLGDLYGRKKLFQASIVIFLVGSALAGISTTMAELIMFRAIQGVGAGGLIVGAQSIMGDVVSPRQRGRYMGYFGALFGATSVAGPLLGGLFTQHLSWRWVFYINIPIGIVALFVIASVLHIPVKRTEHSIDYLGTALLGGAVTALILLTTWGGTTYPWASGPIFIMGILTVVFVVAFYFVERRAAEPLIPLELFKIRTFSISSSIGFIVGLIMFGATIYIPLYLQVVHGSTPTSSGLQLLPLVGGMLITFIPSGRLVTRWGRYKIFPVVGTAVMSIGLFLLSTMTPTTSLLVSSLFMGVLGLGIGLVMQVIVVAVQNAVPYSQLGTVTSATAFFRMIGAAFGVALFGAIFNSQLRSQLPKYLSPGQLHVIAGRNIATNPAQINSLPPALHHGIVLGYSHSLVTVFAVAAPFCVAAFVLSLFLKEIPLRDRVAATTSVE